jgi:beta-ribofuranosylaminobenzene 5'-phosphate synthase
MIKITTPCRLHITLIDMNGELGRVDGGAGLTLSSPNVKITAEGRQLQAEVQAMLDESVS